MKLKKLSATFDDREHGEKARPLGPEVKKRDVGAARDDWSSYLLSNQQANQQMDDEDAPPPIPDPAEPELPQLPESYRRTIDAFQAAFTAQGNSMDVSGPNGVPDGVLDVYDVSSIIDFFMQIAGQGPGYNSFNNVEGALGLFWNNEVGFSSFSQGFNLFYNPGFVSLQGSEPGLNGSYFNAIDDPYGAATTTWADLMAMQDFYESDDFTGSFQPIPLDWSSVSNLNGSSLAGSALDAIFDAYQDQVDPDFFDNLLIAPQPTADDLEDLGAWFDANMLPIMNIYADLYMYNATGDALGYSEGNFQSMMDYIEESGGDMGFLYSNPFLSSGEYNPFSGNIFDVNEDGTFNGADIAAWVDFTEMIAAVTNGTAISETNNIFTQEDIDQIAAYYEYYGIDMAGGNNIYFSVDGEWDNTDNLGDILENSDIPPYIINILDQEELDDYIESQSEDEQLALVELNWFDQRPVWGESFGLNEGLQSENPQWYIALANAIQPWINNGFDVNYAQLGVGWSSWGQSGTTIVTYEAYTQQISSWVAANLFDPDGDGTYDPSELDQSVVDYLIQFHPDVESAADVTPELFNLWTIGDSSSFAALDTGAGYSLQLTGPYLLSQCADWVNSVGGIPDFANILGQESNEAFNYEAQNAMVALLQAMFGHQNPSAAATTPAGFGEGSPSLAYDFEALFAYLGFSSDDAEQIEVYFQDTYNGFLADQLEFNNWLYTGFLGIIGVLDPSTGLVTTQSVGEGVLYAPFGWEPGDNYLDFAYYG